MRRYAILAAMMFFVLTAHTTFSQAGEIDLLVEKLVEKGILTSTEAKIIVDETRQEVAKELASGKSASVPQWVQSMKLKGDLRLRYQYERKTSAAEARDRARLRYRLGIESIVNDKTTVGFGIASGGADPRSTNQTFEDSFETPGLNLDYAFAEYRHNKDLKMVGGKFERKPYLWAPTDLLWDGDITPYGAAVAYTGDLTDNMDYWINGGVLIVDETNSQDRGLPIIKYIQSGLGYKEGNLDSKVSLNFYSPQGVENRTFDYSAGDNTTGANGLKSSYQSIGTSAEIGYKELFGGLPLGIDERIAFFGDFIHNLDDARIKDHLNGWAFGFKFGNENTKKPGEWQFKYMKVKLEKDAWLDFLPDSDRWGGGTGVESHEVSVDYVLKKNIILGLDYYKSWDMADASNKEHLMQADVVFKF